MISAWPSDILLILSAPFIGSFLGLLSYRLPRKENVALGRSRCDRCGATLVWKDLVPILSWVASRGRCRYCSKRIDVTYPMIEISALVIAIWSVSQSTGLPTWIIATVGWILLLLSVIDIKSGLLPNVLTLPLLLAGLLISWSFSGDILGRVIGAAAGFVALYSVARVYWSIRGREGLGLGDAKLFAAAGAWVSWQGLPSVLLIASLGGLGYAGWRSLRVKEPVRGDAIPFGPFLAAGFWAVLTFGPILLY